MRTPETNFDDEFMSLGEAMLLTGTPNLAELAARGSELKMPLAWTTSDRSKILFRRVEVEQWWSDLAIATFTRQSGDSS